MNGLFFGNTASGQKGEVEPKLPAEYQRCEWVYTDTYIYKNIYIESLEFPVTPIFGDLTVNFEVIGTSAQVCFAAFYDLDFIFKARGNRNSIYWFSVSVNNIDIENFNRLQMHKYSAKTLSDQTIVYIDDIQQGTGSLVEVSGDNLFCFDHYNIYGEFLGRKTVFPNSAKIDSIRSDSSGFYLVACYRKNDGMAGLYDFNSGRFCYYEGFIHGDDK